MDREQLEDLAQLQIDVEKLKKQLQGNVIPVFTKRFYYWMALLNAIVIGLIICLHFIVSSIDTSLLRIVSILNDYEAIVVTDVPTQ